MSHLERSKLTAHILVSRIHQDICRWASLLHYTIPLQDWGDYMAWQRNMREGESFQCLVNIAHGIRYLPVAVGALTQIANQATAHASGSRSPDAPAHYDTSQAMEMPIPQPSPARQPSDSSIRSRTYSHAAGKDTYGSLGVSSASTHGYPAHPHSQRSSSESIQSANSGSGRWAEASYEQINKEDAVSEGQGVRPQQGRRTSSGRWFSWAGGAEPKPKVE
jgi:hypothetical protein